MEADRAAYRAGQSQWRACRAQQLASSGRYTGAASRTGRSSSELPNRGSGGKVQPTLMDGRCAIAEWNQLLGSNAAPRPMLAHSFGVASFRR